MKIKEVLVEGPFDYVKGLFKTGSVAGAKAASQQAAGDKYVKDVAKNVIGKWNDYYGRTGDTNIAGWATNFFNRNVGIVNSPDVTDANDVNDYLLTLVKAYEAGQLPNIKSQAEPTQTSQASQPAPSIGATGKRGAGRPMPYRSPLNITIRQATDPIIVNYNGKPYMLNNRGEWSIDGKDSVAAQASGPVQAEIDKVLQSNGLL